MNLTKRKIIHLGILTIIWGLVYSSVTFFMPFAIKSNAYYLQITHEWIFGATGLAIAISIFVVYVFSKDTVERKGKLITNVLVLCAIYLCSVILINICLAFISNVIYQAMSNSFITVKIFIDTVKKVIYVPLLAWLFCILANIKKNQKIVIKTTLTKYMSVFGVCLLCVITEFIFTYFKLNIWIMIIQCLIIASLYTTALVIASYEKGVKINEKDI